MDKINYFWQSQRALRALNEALTQGALTAAVLVGIHLSLPAQAELVFESSTPTAIPTTSAVDGSGAMTREAVREDRQNLREVLNTSQKAEATNTATAQVNAVQMPAAQMAAPRSNPCQQPPWLRR